MSTICEECYSERRRITPLIEPRHCLEKHLQYICGSCGRCICIDRDEKRGLQRWNFPFRSLEIAGLYLRTADVSRKKSCGIYEITSPGGRSSFKIFCDSEELREYLRKNKGKHCKSMEALLTMSPYREFPDSQIRRLSSEEVERYLKEQQEEKKTDKTDNTRRRKG